ncbi:MAG: T9SS type A sorting domain-containing protein [Bacteroidia bacterium]
MLFIFFCLLICIKILAQPPYIINRTGAAPAGTTLIQADIINSNEQISSGDNMSYRGTQSIHLTDGFTASGLTTGGLFHAYIQPLQIAYISTNSGSETEVPYSSANVSGIPQYSRFEIGVQLPVDVQTQITNFLTSSYCQSPGCTPTGINPYNPSQIQIEVDFTNGANTCTRYGFYYQDFTENTTAKLSYNLPHNSPMLSSPWTALATNYPFRVRFAPPATGTWNFNVILKLNGNPVDSFTGGTFNIISSTNPGFLTLDNTSNKMKFSNGNLFYGIGEDIPFATEELQNYVPADPYSYTQIRNTITDLYQKKGNFVRIRFDPWSNPVETNEMQVYNTDPSTVKQPINCINNYDHNQRHMWEFDQTLGLCEQHSVYVMLNLLDDQFFSAINIYGSNYYWRNNPYQALEGPDDGIDNSGVSNPADNGIHKFFTDAQAQSNYQNTLFYINTRWGYSTNIALWEHINETNNLGYYNPPPNGESYYNNSTGVNQFATDVQSWICTMTNYMANFYPKHLQTTGYGGFRSTDAPNLACLDVFSGNAYDGSITANVDKYASHANPSCYGSINGVAASQMNTKPFLLGETGVGCGGANYNYSGVGTYYGVDSDAPDNNSDIEFHKNLWASTFSGGITTELHWTDWLQTVLYPPLDPGDPAADHRALNFPALDDFLIANVNFNQALYPQNEYPCGTIGSSYDGSSLDYFYQQNSTPGTLYKYVDNFFLSNSLTSATLAYGYCYNRSYFWQTDPLFLTYAPTYLCSTTDYYSVNPNDAYGINGIPPPNNTDPPVHFYNMYPNTGFTLTYFETAGATQVGTTSATSDANGKLDFYLPFGAGTHITASTPPDYAYVLNPTCVGCLRTANTSINNTSGASNISTIQNQTKLGSNIKLGIYPNPTIGLIYLNLSAQNAGALLVNITDVNGNQLLHNSFAANEGANSFKLDLSSFNSGVYFINITDENGVPIKNDKLVLMGQ